jgi:putative ABC transport system permease protein
MLRNYFITALRNLLRNRVYSLINISGLAIGMACAVLILLWIQNTVSVDRFHAGIDRIYGVYGNDEYGGKIQSGSPTPEIMAPGLKNDVPEIDKVARVDWGNDLLFTVGDKSLKVHGNTVDADFLSIFSFPLVDGNPQTALIDPYSVLLTQKEARVIFGNEEAMGKIIKVDNGENFKVTGILKDLPNNTAFDFDYLLSYNFKSIKHYIDSDWTDVSIRTFVTLKPNVSFTVSNEKIKNVILLHSGHKSKTTEFLYPLSRIHLYGNFDNGKETGGLINTIRIFMLIAIFILLIACINFMNLSTARSEKRAKEVGVRKVAGALKGALISQFLTESVFIALVAGILAILIVQVSLPAFNTLTGRKLFVDYTNPYFLFSSIGFILLTGLLAGSYPAFFLSAFKPAAVLKGSFKKINALVTPRKVLVITQFTFAIVLIICTLIVEQQVKYAQGRDLGYNKNGLGYVYLEGDDYKNYASIKNELLNTGVASSASKTMAPITQNWSSGISMNWAGKDPNTKIQINRYTADADLIKTMGMKLVEGRDIDVKDYPSDSTACLISEAAVKAMGFKNPIGQMIFDDPISWHVVGVIGDFVLESPYEPIKPFMVKGPKYGGNVIHIKFNPQHTTSQNLAAAEKIFKKYNPAYPFEFHFIDEEYARKFSNEQLAGKLAGLFAALTIFISCLGLFGLATFMAENRIREIGVRKVLGASVSNITFLLSKEFVKLVLISIFIASPIAWWAMDKWLGSYDYHVGLGITTFLVAGGMSVIIALVAVSYQSIKAAVSNPVKSLRME